MRHGSSIIAIRNDPNGDWCCAFKLSIERLFAAGGRVELSDLCPVHHVPERGDIVRTAILILEVVGVFPHVEAKDRRALGTRNRLAHHWIVLVRGRSDLELAMIHDEPSPARAKATSGCGGELLFEGVEAAKGGVDRCTERTGGRSTAAHVGRCHERPKERVIDVATDVVAGRAALIVEPDLMRSDRAFPAEFRRQSVAEVRPEPTPSDSPLAHVFEKLLTAEEYQGGNKPLDGADEMAQHGDALDELDLRHLVRTRERAGSLLRADVAFASGGFEVAGEAPVEAALHYDEWDERHRAYRRQWCAVRVRRMGAPSAAAARAAAAARMRLRRQIRELRAQLARLDRSRAACLRQRDGEDIDIDAVVDHQATLASARAGAGCADEGRLYAARRRRSHEVAALLLIDGSLSTDAWIDGRRVLDVAREAVLVAGEAFGDLAIRIGIASFHSNTRRDCDFAVVKDFAEPWPAARARLFAITPTGYTRIGPALRHGANWLARTGARRRLLLLLSDGKPMDYDRYEGRYGMADVRQAVREMHRLGVQPIALAIDPHSKRHLPAMFDRGAFAILPSAAQLPERLAKILHAVR